MAVKLSDGEVTAQDARQTVNVVMVICVCDPDPNRQATATPSTLSTRS